MHRCAWLGLSVLGAGFGWWVEAQTVMPPLLEQRSSYAAEFSHSMDAPVARGDQGVGDVEATTWRLSYLGWFPVGERWEGRWGFEGRRFDYGTPDGVPLPDMLMGLAVKVGMNWRFAPGWAVLLEVDPGLYSDFEDISADDVNAPTGLRLTWDQRENLTWSFGLRYDRYSEFPVIPGVGLRWRVDDRWTVSLMVPRPAVEYRWSERVRWFAGGELKGGGFRVAEDFGRRFGEPMLDNEQISYREIRVGGGVRVGLAKAVQATVEAGWMIDRRFVYDEVDLQFNGEGAPYMQIGLSGSY